MYLILTASKDAYITNKVINNKFRATDANVGHAGTLDLFKLYNESTLSGDVDVFELSRILIQFDLGSLDAIASSSMNINAADFKASLKLFDIMAGQATPSSFNLVAYPLSQSFDEGIGRDVASFGDLGTVNFITASYSNAASNTWYATGANSGGYLNTAPDREHDYITSGTLDVAGQVDFGITQFFKNGSENLDLDVTTVLSGVLDGRIPDHGFRISFSGSEETDIKTRFVKRFASRHSSNPYAVPQLHLSWDDSIVDNHNDFLFDVTGSLFLNNYHRGIPSDILSGAGHGALNGTDCMKLTLEVQDFSQTFDVSSRTAGTQLADDAGVYSTSFAISVSDATDVNSTGIKLKDLLNKSGSVTFKEYWISSDTTQGYHTGSLVIKPPQRSSYNFNPSDLLFRFTNLNQQYKKGDIVALNVFIEDRKATQKASKLPYNIKSVTLSNVFYRVRDAYTGEVIIPFMQTNNSTRLSSDSSGMYFKFRMESLSAGKVYIFDILITDYGLNKVYEGVSGKFRVVE